MKWRYGAAVTSAMAIAGLALAGCADTTASESSYRDRLASLSGVALGQDVRGLRIPHYQPDPDCGAHIYADCSWVRDGAAITVYDGKVINIALRPDALIPNQASDDAEQTLRALQTQFPELRCDMTRKTCRVGNVEVKTVSDGQNMRIVSSVVPVT